ncbi:ubiquitin-conjugating enzyme E2 J2 [Tremella mesenterica]|uniref:Ubiquitin-conjugating enzyme E2 J2 n=1 Tax=Tremella mesenterica TaxID=5217 RepID=A0A4Q1BMW9_TREME|nr:ubiquitin-conjugating enzyme E2 J2 [Tremella mesenterica]
MATKVAQKRLQKEYLNMQRSPPPFIWACPEEKNILDWHFIIRGPPDSPYDGGEYHGLIWFPSDYPFKPPDVKLFTPSGRFETGVKICMSMTSYHPSTWNAAWSVATILTGLLSFMLSDEITAGAVKTTVEEKRALAKSSHAFNLSNKKFRYSTPTMTDLPDMGRSNPSKQILELGSFTSSSVILTPTLTPTPTPTPTPGPLEIPHQEIGERIENVAVVEGRVGVDDNVQVRNRHGWFSWRWIVAVAMLALLGRLSSLGR